ncbi:hypothetical protein ILUMI_06680 [Ignelater luminosus]|uniref:Uncharacterized protein n=1 Tax=Ignelater luminosus TaxID=2038154 RepID=A0A8K0DAN0_IGNLU|nr:hypothetical protein ILUMI_06680 [Ignelater luminosus]
MYRFNSFINTVIRLSNSSLAVRKRIKFKTYSTATFDINDKVGIITGGAEGVGARFAKKLLQKGLKVLIIGDNIPRDTQTLTNIKNQFGENRITFVKTNVDDYHQLTALFGVALDKWKRLDIVINNAGMNNRQWETEIETNITGITGGTLLGLQYMGLDQGGRGGVIVNVTSVLGTYFIDGFDRSLGASHHFKRTGVKILTMCLGDTNTPLAENISETTLKNLPLNKRNLLPAVVKELPEQEVGNVASDLIYLIRKGHSASMWISEDNEPLYEVEYHPSQKFRPQLCKL